MYQAKLNGKGGYAVFDSAMNERVVERVEIEADLRHALENEEFRVYYQPIIDLDTGVINEAEALARWQHPTRGLVSPAKFIPIAEETGLIVPLGAWVLSQACRQAKIWQEHQPASHAFMMSVNISGRQLQNEDLCRVVAETLRESGLPPSSLKLEITESVMMEDIDAAIVRLNALKELGVLFP